MYLFGKSYFLKLTEFSVSRKLQLIQCWYTDYMIVDAFTQIVWMGTQTCGIAIRREERTYRVVVHYKPHGNIPKQFTSNVFRPGSTDQGESSANNW